MRFLQLLFIVATPPKIAARLLLLGSLVTRARAPEPRRRLTDLTRVTRPHAHHTRVDGAGHAVLELHVQLRQSVRLEHTGIPHITLATSLDDIAYLCQRIQSVRYS